MSVSFVLRWGLWFGFWGSVLGLPASGRGDWRSFVAALLALGCSWVWLSAWLRWGSWLWCRVCLVLGWSFSLCGWVRGAAVVLGWLPPSVPALCRLRVLSPAAVDQLSPRLRFWRWVALRSRVSSW